MKNSWVKLYSALFCHKPYILLPFLCRTRERKYYVIKITKSFSSFLAPDVCAALTMPPSHIQRVYNVRREWVGSVGMSYLVFVLFIVTVCWLIVGYMFRSMAGTHREGRQIIFFPFLPLEILKNFFFIIDFSRHLWIIRYAKDFLCCLAMSSTGWNFLLINSTFFLLLVLKFATGRKYLNFSMLMKWDGAKKSLWNVISSIGVCIQNSINLWWDDEDR